MKLLIKNVLNILSFTDVSDSSLLAYSSYKLSEITIFFSCSCIKSLASSLKYSTNCFSISVFNSFDITSIANPLSAKTPSKGIASNASLSLGVNILSNVNQSSPRFNCFTSMAISLGFISPDKSMALS